MFLAAVARPRYDAKRRRKFAGKIGIWPIVENAVALGSFKNRPKGTLVLKCINMDRAVYTRFVMEKVLLSIKARWQGMLHIIFVPSNVISLIDCIVLQAENR